MTQTGFAGDVRRQAVGCRRARTLENWLVGHCQPVETSGQDIELHPAVVDLQSLIATDRVVGIYVSRMIAQVPETRSYSKRHLNQALPGSQWVATCLEGVFGGKMPSCAIPSSTVRSWVSRPPGR